MSLKYHSLLLIMLFAICKPVHGQEQGYIWPTDASQHLTSTFGETRSAHYHSGIDIKTWGKEGYKVFASKSGVVHRLAVSEKGYGKVIYLKHDDGSYTVYAHLQRFRDDYQAYVDSIRMQDYSFEVDLEVGHLDMKVEQGEVIGFTGSTGVGPPHLHFETRKADETPFNTLLTNLNVRDSMPPVLSALLVFPLSDSTRIRNSYYPQLYYPKRNGRNEIDFGIIEANGSLGLSISTFDEADGVTNKYAVYELTLLSDSDTLFHEKLDSFSFKEDDLMLIDRLTAFGATRRSYQTLFKKDGPKNPFYEIVDQKTVITPSDSLTHFEIIANDYYGNTTKAFVAIDGGILRIDQKKTLVTKPIQEWYWSEDWVYTGTKTLDLRKSDYGTSWNSDKSQIVCDIKEKKHVLFSRFIPSQKYQFSSPDRKLSVRFQEDSFFDTLTVAAYHSIFEDYKYINIQPGMIPARKEFEIQFYLENDFEPDNNYRLFRYERDKKRVKYVDSKLIGKTVHAYPSGLGEFLVIPDNEPPVLEEPKLIETSYGKWLIEVKSVDKLTGIDFENTQIFVNGVQGIVEYDNEEDLLVYYHPGFFPKKTNVVTVSVKDKVGNQTRKSYQL